MTFLINAQRCSLAEVAKSSFTTTATFVLFSVLTFLHSAHLICLCASAGSSSTSSLLHQLGLHGCRCCSVIHCTVSLLVLCACVSCTVCPSVCCYVLFLVISRANAACRSILPATEVLVSPLLYFLVTPCRLQSFCN